jgi:alkylation response protein AidB-like acyl-CoA dehydrogenase
MDFTPTAEQRQIREMVAEFVDEEVVPRASDIDKRDEFPHDIVSQMADLGLLGMPIPEADGGAGLDYHSYVMALEEISRGSGGLGTIAARGVGIAQAALDAALSYAREREQFGQPIGEFQAIQHKLADMDTKTEAARLLMHRAADLKERGDVFVTEAAQAKLYASEVSREVANEGIQIHGGYGYTREFPAERFYRDAKLNEIYEGTSEVLRNTIADQLL